MIGNLPELVFAAKDPLLIEQEIVARYEDAQNRKLGEADPALIFLKTVVYLITQIRSAIDYTGKQNLLAYALDDALDHKGIDTDTLRNPAKPATVTVRFTLSAAQLSAVTITQNTRVTAGDNIFFAVKETAQILPGDLSVNCLCECQTVGAAGNNYQVGEITTLVDPIPYVSTVVNIDSSAGGIEKEDNDIYRERIQLAPEKFSTAGPIDAYKYWAKTATQNIIDVVPYKPTPGVVKVAILMINGTMPTLSEKALVTEVLNEDKIRPFTDSVEAVAPEVVDYDIELTYYIRFSDAISALSIQGRVNAAIDAFVLWQKTKIGRDVNPSKLISDIVTAGAKRVELLSPNNIIIPDNQVAIAASITINYGGLEGE